MPGQSFDRDVFAAGASAATDWASVEAAANVGFRGNIEANRGIDIDLGLMGIANLDASISRFLAADLQGTASAQASVRAQLQMPMNLFKEVGLAVRLQAIAELAAGIRLGLGLKLSHFLELAQADQRMAGLPADLLLILLDESTSAPACMPRPRCRRRRMRTSSSSDSALGDLQRQLPPGFTIAAGAGVGLKAGAGFQISATVGISNFGRLVARTSDVLVDAALGRIAQRLTDVQLRKTVWAARVPMKLALRLTYELGEQLAVRRGSNDARGQAEAALRIVQVTLEELQKGVLDGTLKAGLARIAAVLKLAQQARAAWTACRAERHALADLIEAPPEDILGEAAEAFWANAVDLGVALAVKLGGPRQAEIVRLCAILWSAFALARALSARVTRAQGHVSLIGTSPVQLAAAFTGPLPRPPRPEVAQEISNEAYARRVHHAGPRAPGPVPRRARGRRPRSAAQPRARRVPDQAGGAGRPRPAGARGAGPEERRRVRDPRVGRNGERREGARRPGHQPDVVPDRQAHRRPARAATAGAARSAGPAERAGRDPAAGDPVHARDRRQRDRRLVEVGHQRQSDDRGALGGAAAHARPQPGVRRRHHAGSRAGGVDRPAARRGNEGRQSQWPGRAADAGLPGAAAGG